MVLCFSTEAIISEKSRFCKKNPVSMLGFLTSDSVAALDFLCYNGPIQINGGY